MANSYLTTIVTFPESVVRICNQPSSFLPKMKSIEFDTKTVRFDSKKKKIRFSYHHRYGNNDGKFLPYNDRNFSGIGRTNLQPTKFVPAENEIDRIRYKNGEIRFQKEKNSIFVSSSLRQQRWQILTLQHQRAGFMQKYKISRKTTKMYIR